MIVSFCVRFVVLGLQFPVILGLQLSVILGLDPRIHGFPDPAGK